MMNLAEYRNRNARLADYLPWAALVGQGVVLNKDGSFQRTAKFRGPDLDSAVAAELVAVAGRINNAFRRLGSGWSIFVEAQRSEAATYPDSKFPDAASALFDAERKAGFEEAGTHFVSGYFLTFLYLPPAEEAARAETWPVMATPAVDQAEQRRLAEEEAARLSRVFFQTAPGTGTATAAPGIAGLGIAGQPGATGAQDRHTAFLNGPVDRRTVAADRITPPASPYILQAGAVIPAAMITGIRSDLPGQITAQVTENVYDSPTGSLLLIPQGTRIIGEYDAGVTFGQRRVLLVWNRLILPNGRSIVLERQPGADASGYAGLEDGVDYHWWDLMKAAGLSTLLGVGTELATSDEDRLIRAIRDGAQDTINQAGQQIVQRQLQVAPTLTIRPGFPVRVIVTRDLVFEPAGG